ncbi:uncharacterized protein BKA78DRAFT_111330 [Phyllosticta capitalensis]|uniref:uncharacterized protein n=1 Tax=Phyllosticta capitalensis TaxID=121624 RepID=UPI003131266D
MKATLFFATTLVASAFAQSSSETLAVSSSPSASSTSISSVENSFTSFLTQTNSLGVVTGQPAVVTSQPSVATIPALGTGTYTIAIGNTTNIVVTVGSSTTAVISGDAVITTSGSSVYVAATNTASHFSDSLVAKKTFAVLSFLDWLVGCIGPEPDDVVAVIVSWFRRQANQTTLNY